MKRIPRLLIFSFLVIFSPDLSGQVYKLVSWNIQHFGKTKDTREIEVMANSLKDADFVAIQEVVAGYGGSQAVARLIEELNLRGASWEYMISDPTQSSPQTREKYAFLWKKHKVKPLGRATLDKNFEEEINREPYRGRFLFGGKELTIFSFHARPKQSQPEREIKYVKFFPRIYPDEALIFLGDFNLPQKHTVFNPIKKMGYKAALINQKTSLKKKFAENRQYLANPLDNIFFHPEEIRALDSGVIDFTLEMDDLSEANQVSNHLPVYLVFELLQK
ncbi:MAG: endonuclease/exonuclease/phosphatase family protein [Bacteroidota bacterium]